MCWTHHLYLTQAHSISWFAASEKEYLHFYCASISFVLIEDKGIFLLYRCIFQFLGLHETVQRFIDLATASGKPVLDGALHTLSRSAPLYWRRRVWTTINTEVRAISSQGSGAVLDSYRRGLQNQRFWTRYWRTQAVSTTLPFLCSFGSLLRRCLLTFIKECRFHHDKVCERT